jgi:hypothetical protein
VAVDDRGGDAGEVAAVALEVEQAVVFAAA